MSIKARNLRLLALALLCILVLLGIRFLFTSQPVTPSWRGITPGKSTQEDVIRILGQPTEKFSAPSKFIYNDAPYGVGDYAYTPQQEILFKDEKVWLIIEDRFNGSQKDGKQASDIVKQYGTPEDVLWASVPSSSLRILLFCKQGLFVRGNSYFMNDFFYFVPVETQACIQEFPDYIAVLNPAPHSDDISARDPWGYSAPTDAPQNIKAVWPRPDRDLPLSAYNKYLERPTAESGVGVRLSTKSFIKYGTNFEAFDDFLRRNVSLYVDNQLIPNNEPNTEYQWLYIWPSEISELHWVLHLKAGHHEARFEYTDDDGTTSSYEWKFTLTDQ